MGCTLQAWLLHWKWKYWLLKNKRMEKIVHQKNIKAGDKLFSILHNENGGVFCFFFHFTFGWWAVGCFVLVKYYLVGRVVLVLDIIVVKLGKDFLLTLVMDLWWLVINFVLITLVVNFVLTFHMTCVPDMCELMFVLYESVCIYVSVCIRFFWFVLFIYFCGA